MQKTDKVVRKDNTMKTRMMQVLAALAVAATVWAGERVSLAQSARTPFNVMETTIDEIHKAYREHRQRVRVFGKVCFQSSDGL